MSVASAASFPSASVAHGVSGAPFEHDRASGRERRRELRERELDRIVVRRDRADDARGLLLDPTVVAAGERVALAEVLDELVTLEQIGVPAHDLDRAFELRSARAGHRRADLAHDDLAQRLDVVEQRLVELAQAPNPELGVASTTASRRTPGAPRRSPAARPRAWRRRRCRAPPRSPGRRWGRSRRRTTARGHRRSTGGPRARSSRHAPPGASPAGSAGSVGRLR